jgi:phosphoribosylanthranilate isomerase
MSAVRVKICGITNLEDALAAVEAGADALGFNFYEQSPRFITPERAAMIVRNLPPFIDTVGVFVGMRTRQACAVAYQLGLGVIQLFADLTDVEEAFPFRRLVAFRVRDEHSLRDVENYLKIAPPPTAILVDAFVSGHLGGTGQTAPWDLLADFRPGVPVVLAGGLKPENVVQAIQRVRPYAVDVASGVETAPGRKDANRMSQFVAAARQAL